MAKFLTAALLLFVPAVTIVAPAQTLTTLYTFCSQQSCPDGSHPYGALLQASDGNFYGTTPYGGAFYSGTVFKMLPNGTLTTSYSFCSQPNCTDGDVPTAGLVQATNGNFYGTTYYGGAYSNTGGTVFAITPSGSLTSLHSFCSQPNCPDGSEPSAGVVQANDGNFYGTTSTGGSGYGTVFKITPSGALTTLHSFGGADGDQPNAIVQATDGNFYGTTYEGGNNDYCGANGCGTIFKISSSGALTTLYNFCSQSNCTDGFEPTAALVQATDGNFYGTTYGGGTGDGTIFKITPSGTLTTLYSFCSEPNCADGSNPGVSLIQGTDGNFYGTTVGGGTGAYGPSGTIFRINRSGTLTTLYNFCSQPNCADGSFPQASLVQGADGNFYGSTSYGGDITNCNSGAPGCGTIFRFSVEPLQFVPVTPCRVVDTRNQNGQFGGPPIPGGTYRSFPLAQGTCNIPPTATAYSLNVTLVPIQNQPVGYLTIWPAGSTQPLVSTMNSLDGRIKANAAIVPAGASGAVSVYVTNTANVVLDIDGYFAPSGQSTLQFFPLTPCRVADTRSNNYPQGLGQPHLSARVARDFPVLNSPCLTGIQAAAYSFNLTAVPYPNYGAPLGYLEIWPTGQQPQNPVSTLNNLTGTYVANAAIVPAGSNGEITTYPDNDTDLVIDINGYFAGSRSGGLSLYPTIPCRVIDTRKIGNGQPFTGTLAPPVDVVDSPCGIPSTAQAFVFNATVVPSGSLSYLTLWPDSENQPIVSTLNAADGWITSNLAIVPNVNGSIDAYAAGLTQLILDISGYFAQ